MSHRDNAKRLLRHYLAMAIGNLDSDNRVEIDDIIDEILAAAKEEYENRITESESYSEYKHRYNK